MALVSIYGQGKIQDLETTLRKNRVLKPKPGLLTSFSNRVGAIILGVFFIVFGIGCGWALFTQHPTFFEKLVLFLGMLCTFLGFMLLGKALYAFGKAARPYG